MIELQDISKTFHPGTPGEKTVIKDLSLKLEPGDFLTIIGSNGAGKSTLFNRILGERRAIVEDIPGVTRDRNYADVTRYDRHFTLIDTGGFEPISEDRMLIQMREQGDQLRAAGEHLSAIRVYLAILKRSPEDYETRLLLGEALPQRGIGPRHVGDALERPGEGRVGLGPGGGGTAFSGWAVLWAKRGYAALAMDTASGNPTYPRPMYIADWPRQLTRTSCLLFPRRWRSRNWSSCSWISA